MLLFKGNSEDQIQNKESGRSWGRGETGGRVREPSIWGLIKLRLRLDETYLEKWNSSICHYKTLGSIKRNAWELTHGKCSTNDHIKPCVRILRLVQHTNNSHYQNPNQKQCPSEVFLVVLFVFNFTSHLSLFMDPFSDNYFQASTYDRIVRKSGLVLLLTNLLT